MDPEGKHYPQLVVCHAEMQAEAAKRLYQMLHKDRPYHDGSFKNWAEKASRDYPFHFMDGVSIFTATTDLEPDATWLDGEVLSDDPRGGDD